MRVFPGVAPDSRVLAEDLANLPDAERFTDPAVRTLQPERLGITGSVLTGVNLIGGLALLVYSGGPPTRLA